MKRIAFMLCALIACDTATQTEDKPVSGPVDNHHDEEGHDALPSQLRLTPEVVRESGIAVQPAKRAVLTAVVSLSGEIVAEPDRMARVSAVTAGRLEQVSFNEGQAVKKGDVLAVLRVPDVGRLRGSLAAAAARAKASRANAERLQSLRDSGLGAEQAVVDAEAEARSQEAEARAVGEQLAAIGVNADAGGGYLVPLRSPITGVVVARDAVVGQPVTADQVIASVVDFSEVWFLGRVFEKDLARLRVGAKCEVQLNAYPGDSFAGFVEYVGQRTDPVARTLTARIKLRNDGDRLRIGLFGTAHVELAESSQAAAQIIVPRSAVTDVGGKHVVFVQAADGDFVVHEVRLGNAALAQVEVLSGLSEGENVVIGGVFTLKSLLLKSTLAEDDH